MPKTSRRITALCNQSTLAITALAGGATVSETALADVLTFETRDLQLVVGKPESKVFDLNNDGIIDFEIRVKQGKGGSTLASIHGGKSVAMGDGIFGSGQKAGIFLSGKSSQGPLAKRFDDKGSVSKGTGGANGDFAVLYDTFDNPDRGPFADVGDRGFIGLFLEPLLFEEVPAQVLDVDTITALEVQEEEGDVGEKPRPDRFYGWLELERGSINTFRVGFQSAPNTAAPIPDDDPIDVPEPASLPLMALGAVGLMAVRRKRAA